MCLPQRLLRGPGRRFLQELGQQSHGRKVGAAAGYQYSPALKSAGFTWDQSSFADFMQNPRTKVPGNKMAFVGMKDKREIAGLWAYLQQFNADGNQK